jgi:virginiamycin B lyase
MRLQSRFFASASLLLFFASVCHGATITGTVKNTEGAPFQGAFVEAQNTSTRITVIVLSDNQGQYRIENLPAGEYRVQIRAVGFLADPRTGVKLKADQKASYDFALQKGMVHWNDLSLSQARQLWPPATGKDLIVQNCNDCHLFQTRIASVTRDAAGWKDRLEYMRTSEHYGLSYITDQQADDIASYLTWLFGPSSVLPKSPADMPGYKDTVRPFSSDAMNIVYVEYEMPGPNRMPFSAAPDKNGYFWIPYYGPANKIARLDPKTGEVKEFPVANVGTAAIHSAVPAPDGSVWLAETGANKLGRWDPNTQQITEFQDPYLPGKEGVRAGGTKHTIRFSPNGTMWVSGYPLSTFDPETRKFTHFNEVPSSYDVKIDRNGDPWFTSPQNNKIGKVDSKTMKVTQWTLPTDKSFPRRLEVGPDGMIWIGEFSGGKIARFDPATQTFKEYPLPGLHPTPYALGFDTDGYFWYDSHHMDVLGRFDTKTGDVIEYPFPHSEIAMREFFRDSQGRMWYATNPNNKVGYFYLADKGSGTKSASN